MNLTPPTWLITILAAAAAALVKLVFDTWIAPMIGPTGRMKRAERAAEKSAAATARGAADVAAVGSPTSALHGTHAAPALDLQLLSKEVESLRLRQELSEAQAALMRLRGDLTQARIAGAQEHAEVEELRALVEQLQKLRISNDRAALENARLSGQLAAERENNLQLKAENETLRREGGDVPDPRLRALPMHTVEPQFAVERVRGTNQAEMKAARKVPRKGTKMGP